MEKQKRLLMTVGAVIGFINGLFGGGGGMIAVPIFEKYLRLNSKQAHATAIAVILPISTITAVIYLIAGRFNLAVGLWCSSGVVLGGTLGAILLNRLKTSWIKNIFLVVMLLAGIKLLVW